MSRITIHDDSNMVDFCMSAKNGIFAHGVNCQGVMRSGIAREFRDKYREVYESYEKYVTVYLKSCRDNGLLNDELSSVQTARQGLLGQVDLVTLGGNKDKLVANCFTQLNYGRDTSVIYADYDAIQSCFEKLAILPQAENGIHFPLIGAGLANGDWEKIKKRILKVTPGYVPLHLHLFSSAYQRKKFDY